MESVISFMNFLFSFLRIPAVSSGFHCESCDGLNEASMSTLNV